MKYSYPILIIFCAATLFSQTPRFEVKPNPNSIFFPCDSTDHDAQGLITNNTNNLINILWVREIVQLPVKWSTYVCDVNYCYIDRVDKCPKNYPDTISPGNKARLDVHVLDSGFIGEAHIIMWVFEKEDTTNKLKVDYYFNQVVSNNSIKNIEIKVYPNPASNSFTIDYNQGLNRIELYSILGNKVSTYRALPHNNYDISQLEDGLYVIKLIGPNEQSLRTVRLHKSSQRQ